MSALKKVESALISVYHKDGLEEVVRELHLLGVKLFSTGGTQSFIEGLNIPVTPVEGLTGYPSILGGRVKTLHPKVFGGILARRELKDDLAQLNEYEIPEIDLVVVDLYPFEATVASGASAQEIVEKIDIGGISLIRAAAKNHKDVCIVASQAQYATLLNILKTQKGESTLADRRALATSAFAVSSHYDSAIFNYFAGSESDALRISENNGRVLRYGENPHQKGQFFGKLDEMFTQLHGKEISYNNLLDIDAAVQLIAEFSDTTVAILKHNNACGLASRPVLCDAWNAALAGDPVSAFGGVIIANQPIDAATAQEMDKIFFEVAIAPGYEPDALEILQRKKNRMILLQKHAAMPVRLSRTLLNGVLVQDKDTYTDTQANLQEVTDQKATPAEVADMLFAQKIVKHTKSNAIVLAKNKQLLASGTGQTSRVDALKQAIAKAHSFSFELKGAVMASDAFFPFADSIAIAHEAGISAVIQPGGSVRDQDTVAYCNQNHLAMVFTGIRHFKH